MLIVRAPMRISLAGGGTDVPAYYERFGGMVVSTAIDKYVYVFISPNGHGSLQISSADYSTFFRHSGGNEVAEEGKLRYARAFLRDFGVRAGYSVFMASEMPPGTGLGSSSALAVALTKALAAVTGDILSKGDVAETAARIEIDRLKMPIGKQDQFAAAFGGLNCIHFSADGVSVEPLPMTDRIRRFFQESLLIFFTDQSHDSAEILSEQKHRILTDPDALATLHNIRGHAVEVRQAILDDQPERLGEILHRTWIEKKKVAHGVSNQSIDDAYIAAREAGATGGKIAGAGGGGFLLLVCPSEKHDAVVETMEKRGMFRADFHSDSAGARILVNNESG